MADPDFVEAIPPGGGEKRLVPTHYLDNPAFGYKLPPSQRVKEPAKTDTETVTEPAVSGEATVEEPAAADTKTSKRTAAGGEPKEA